jgi:hypothetical protein
MFDTVKASTMDLHIFRWRGTATNSKKTIPDELSEKITQPQSLSLDKISVAKSLIVCQGGFFVALLCEILLSITRSHLLVLRRFLSPCNPHSRFRGAGREPVTHPHGKNSLPAGLTILDVKRPTETHCNAFCIRRTRGTWNILT